MKKRLLSIFLSCALLISTIAIQIPVLASAEPWDTWDGTSVSTSLSGGGTDTDPYQINSAADLLYIANNASGTNTFAGKFFLLNTNINLANKAFPAIHTFAGTLDGNDYEIKGVNISLGKGNVGFFRILQGTVENLTLSGEVNEANYDSIGGFAGIVNNAGATIRNCVNNLNVTGRYYVGGFIGNGQYAGSAITITNCVNNGDVVSTCDGSGNALAQVGGFIGDVGGNVKVLNITYSQNNGDVSATASSAVRSVGGFVGSLRAVSTTIDYCVNTGTITAPSTAGGIIARNNEAAANVALTLSNTINVGEIVASEADVSSSIGGIFGFYQTVKGTKNVSNVYYRESDIKFSAAGNAQSTSTPVGEAKTDTEFANGTVLDLLNAVEDVFVQVDEYPILIIANVSYESFDVWDGSAVSTELSGSGAIDDPYLIQSAADLKFWSDKAASGSYYADSYFRLTTNIDLGDRSLVIYKFSGTFDGNGYEIKGLKVVYNTLDNVGFIRFLDGTVKNLTLTGSVWGKSNVGGFAGSFSSKATFINCVNNVAVKGEKLVGGFIGNLYPSAAATVNIFSCVNNGTVTSTTTGTAATCTGGFVGNVGANATVNFLYSINNGAVTSGATDTAGFVGSNYGNLKFDHCINAGTVSGNYAAGGFLGWNRAANNTKTLTLNNCINIGTIKATRTDGGNGWLDGILGVHSSSQNKSTTTADKVYSINGCLDFGTSVNNQSTATSFIGTRKDLSEFTANDTATLLGFLYVLDKDGRPTLRQFSKGNGSVDDPYVLKTKEDLVMLSQIVCGEQLWDYPDALITLGNDINLEGDTRFVGIGNGYKSFKGDFDGNGYTVSGLDLKHAHTGGLGFFGQIGGTNERKISNLNVEGNVISTATTNTTTKVGGLVGKNTAKLTIENCSFNGTVKSTYNVNANTPAASGLVCSAEAALTIEKCSVFGQIDGYGRGGSLLGSLTGNFAVNINNSYSTATVTGDFSGNTGNKTAGGLVGYIENGTLRLTNCFFAGTAPEARSNGFAGPVINYKAGGTVECVNTYYNSDENAAEPDGHGFGVGKTTAEFKDGTVVALLNATEDVFEQGVNYPKFKGQVITDEGGSGNQPDGPGEDDDEEFNGDVADGKTYVVWDGSVSTSLTGTGTNVDPFVINNGADLKYFADQVNSGNDYSGKFVKLAANIDLNNINFTPIGNRAKWFRGVFDGNGYTVKNLKVVSDATNGIGFFGGCHNAKVLNLTVRGIVKGTTCTTSTPVAGLVAIANGGSMENCAFIGTVYSANATSTYQNYPSASGLVCLIEGNYDIDRCYVSGVVDGYGRSGGLIGSVNGPYNITITNSYCDAKVTGVGAETTNAATAGGLVGFLNTGIITLENCYFVGTAPVIRSSGYGGPIINHKASGTLNCINVFYLGTPSEFTAHNVGENKTATQFKDGTVLNILNDGEVNPIFEQGDNYPVLVPVAIGDGSITDRYIRKYTFDNHPGSIDAYNSNPKKYQNDGYYIDTINGEKSIGARLYNYGRYNNNAILAPSAKYANGSGYGTVYSANLGGVFSYVDLSEIKANAFYRFSVDAKVVDVEPEVTVQIGLFRASGASTYGTLSFQDANGNTYDTAIKTTKLTLDKKTDYKTYTIEISGQEILSFLENYSDNANVLYFGIYCPTHINKVKYKDVVGMALDNFVAFETAIPDGYVPADSLPAVDILDGDYAKSYGEHMYNVIENSSFEKELTGIWSNLPKGFSVKTASDNDAMFGQKYLSADAKSGTVKIAVPFNLTINKFYTFGISTRTSANAKYRIYISDSANGSPLYDVDDSTQKFLINENSKDGEIVRNGIYFRSTMKTNATQYLVIEVTSGTVDIDEITLTRKDTTEKNRNYYEKTGGTKIKVYDAKSETEKDFTIPFGKTIYDMVKEIKEWLK